MFRFAKIYTSVILLLGLAVGVHAQGQSRLEIGKSPQSKALSNKPLSSYTVPKGGLPLEVRVNKNSALTAFYRDLLLNKRQKGAEAKSAFEPINNTDNDLFYSDESTSLSNIYPNPASDYAVIDYQIRNGKTAKVSFINILGGSMGDFELRASDNSLQVNTRSWNNGIYFYQLILDGKKVATKKLLVRHN